MPRPQPSSWPRSTVGDAPARGRRRSRATARAAAGGAARSPPSVPRSRARRAPAARRVAPLPGLRVASAAAVRRLPAVRAAGVRHRPRHAALRSTRARGRSRSGSSAAPSTPFDYVTRGRRLPAQPEFNYAEQPAAAAAGRRAAGLLHQRLAPAGYCQHYAGAMALLLRMGGIPARVATGFTPGGYSERHKAWIVRDTDAHAWVEVWFDRYGWVTLDPTPDATPARSQIAALDRRRPRSRRRRGPRHRARRDAARTGRARAQRRASRSCCSTASDASGGAARRRRRRPALALWRARRLRALGAAPLVVRLRRGPAADADGRRSPSSRRRCAASAARSAPARRCASSSAGSAATRRRPAGYLRALAAGRYAPAPPPPPRAGRRALRRALAQGLGLGGRLRAFWALPPRMR